jgi:2-polyprenyl-3-methyl-5-hydroxy-6-metoxy-1,4-benzoquinol methylase
MNTPNAPKQNGLRGLAREAMLKVYKAAALPWMGDVIELRNEDQRIVDLYKSLDHRFTKLEQEVAEVLRLFKVRYENEDRLRYVLNELGDQRALLRYLLPDSPNYAAYMAQTRKSFDYQWGHIPMGHDLVTDEAFRAEAVARLERFTGLPRSWFAGKRVLDAGCGNGRWSWTLTQVGANVTAVDQSPAGVESVRKLCAGAPGFAARVHNLLEPLGEPGAYDLVWSFGVVHHTGNTWLATRHVAEAVKPGGHLFLMVYGEPRWEEPGDFIELNEYIELRRMLRTMSFDARIAWLREHKGEKLAHGLFDAASPEINDLHRLDELAAWLEPLGFAEVRSTFPSRNLHVVARRAARPTT